MSVLPQLESQLRAAHGRRRRRARPPLAVVGTTAAVAVVVAVVVVAAGVGHRQRALGITHPEGGGGGWTRLLLKHVDSVRLYETGGSLYVGEDELSENAPPPKLVRLDPGTGKVLATALLGDEVSDAVFAGGCLWVTSTTYRREYSTTTLWKLDPSSLAVLSRFTLPRGIGYGPAGATALAGAGLWVADTDRLLHVSLPSGRVIQQILLRGVDGVAVWADPSGRILLDSAGNGQGAGRIERRDPVTGALLARSPEFQGAVQPAIGGVIDGGIWYSQSGGMMGHVDRLSLTTLRPTPVDTPQIATNGITANVLDGVLWISQTGGGSQRNYCGDPVTGKPLASFTNGPEIGFVTADTRHVYLQQASTPRSVILIREAINPRCR